MNGQRTVSGVGPASGQRPASSACRAGSGSIPASRLRCTADQVPIWAISSLRLQWRSIHNPAGKGHSSPGKARKAP